MTSLDQQMKKGMGYGELIVDNIIGLDNEYESFGEKLGKAINEDEIGFLKNAAVGIYEGAKEFVTSPIETTKEVITDIKDSVQRLGSEDLSKRLQSMYGVSYDQATDQQVNSAREAVLGDAMTALGLIPAAKATTVTAKAASSAIPSGVKADIVGQTKAVFGGDMEFLKGTPTERSGTVGVGAEVVGQDDVSFDDITNYIDLEVEPSNLTVSKKQTNPLVQEINYNNTDGITADLYDFRSSVLGSLDNLAIGKDGMSGFQIKKFLEKRAPKINKTELYWSGLLENLDDNKKYSKQQLKTLADRNVPKVDIQVLDGNYVRYRNEQRVNLNVNNNVMQPLDGYREIVIVNNNTKGTKYSAGHYDYMFEPDGNVLAHVRGSFVENNEPDFPIKEKFFLVEELQSDAVQQHTVADKAITKKIKEQETSKPTLGDIGLHYQTEIGSTIYSSFVQGLDFTDKFVKDIDRYNYNFRSITDGDTGAQAINLGLTKIIDDITKLKSGFVDGNRSKDAIAVILSREYGLKENSIKRRSIEELDEVDNIFANVLSDYVFGKSAARKYNKENNNELKENLIETFKGINITAGLEKDLVPAKLSDTIRMSLLAVIKESKSEGVNKIYIPSPKVISKAHDLNLEAAKNTYSDGVRKVLRTLNSETNGRIKFKNGNPDNITYYDGINETGIEIDITDFNLPDNPQFRFDRGGLAVSQTEQIMGMPTAGDPAIIDPTTGQPYSPVASMRQQAEMTRQAEAMEEFNLLQNQKRADVRDRAKVSTLLETPETENLAEEITEDLNELKDPLGSTRPKARPKELEQKVGKLYQSAIKKAIELDYISKEEGLGEEFGGYLGTKSNLRELDPESLPTITKFITQALGAFDPNQDVTKAGVYWCAAFVNHILTEMGADTLGKGDRYKRLRAQEYKNYGQEVSFEDMQEGDILLFGVPELNKVTHVGFYTGERNGEYVNMLGGNQRSEKTLGELVNIVPRSLKDIVGVRRVTYDKDASKIIEDQKGSNSIFRYFDADTYKASFMPSENRTYSQGGEVGNMNKQTEMAFMQEGGLKDDGMKQDPVSGNPIPNGSMAKEVRDDISAQLSEGEYVVPADVVRYLGVKHFEDLRNKAKEGLQSMEANGRIGGEPVPVGGPKAAPMMQQQMQPPMPQAPTPYSPAPTPQQMAMGGDLSPEEMQEINSIMMAQGGMVPTDPYQQQQTQYQQPMAAGAANGTDMSPYNSNFSFYNPPGMSSKEAISTPNVYSPNFSWETPAGGTAIGTTESEVPVESEETCKARGMVYNPDTKMCEVPLPTVSTRDDTGPSISDEQDKPADPNAWMDNYDYTNSESLLDTSLDALKSPESGTFGALVDRVFGKGVLGVLGKAGIAAQVAANVKLLEAQGANNFANKLSAALEGYKKTNDLNWVPNFLIGGDQLAKSAAEVINLDLGAKERMDAATEAAFGAKRAKELSEKYGGTAGNKMASGYLEAMTAPERKKLSKKLTETAEEKRKEFKASQPAKPAKDDDYSAADMMRDRLDKKSEGGKFSGSVTGGAVYAGGNRAEGGLMLKKKNK